MFGVIFFVFFVICCLVKAIQPMKKEMKNYKKALKNGDDYFINRDGYRTDTKYGVSYNYKYLWTDDNKVGDYVKYNPYNGHILENVSERLRGEFEEESRKMAIERSLRFYPFESKKNEPHDYDINIYEASYYKDHMYDSNVVGCRYRDIKTDRICVVRDLNGLRFILDVDTLKPIGFIPEKDGNGNYYYSFYIPEKGRVKLDDTKENINVLVDIIKELQMVPGNKAFNKYNVSLKLISGRYSSAFWLREEQIRFVEEGEKQ